MREIDLIIKDALATACYSLLEGFSKNKIRIGIPFMNLGLIPFNFALLFSMEKPLPVEILYIEILCLPGFNLKTLVTVKQLIIPSTNYFTSYLHQDRAQSHLFITFTNQFRKFIASKSSQYI